ncbi:hypothetical protein BKN38_09725 [Helicobacter sp. CLO-3]|nr:hypothetical protein BA723_09310 [Helicobacter sp. CLO-3]OHU81086.1 hypothetical protein BKN38_09725 [Helicobacter sp. CLO-3]
MGFGFCIDSRCGIYAESRICADARIFDLTENLQSKFWILANFANPPESRFGADASLSRFTQKSLWIFGIAIINHLILNRLLRRFTPRKALASLVMTILPLFAFSVIASGLAREAIHKDIA